MRICRLSLLVICFLLVGCGKNSTTAQLLRNPSELKQASNQCSQSTSSSTYCQRVNHAMSLFSKYVFEIEANPMAYGKTVLKLQMQVADLESQQTKLTSNSKQSTREELIKQVQQHKQEYQNRIAIISVLESPR